MELRDYQDQIVTENLTAMDAGCKSTLNGLFTGAGKTVIFVSMAARILGRTLIICPLRELVWQAVEKVRDITAEDPAIEMADFHAEGDDWWSPKIVVASKQTLLSRRKGEPRYKKFTDFSLVIVDEAHLMCSAPVIEMFQFFQANGAMVAGFSATPFRMDGKAMMRETCISTSDSSEASILNGQSITDGQCPPSAS